MNLLTLPTLPTFPTSSVSVTVLQKLFYETVAIVFFDTYKFKAGTINFTYIIRHFLIGCVAKTISVSKNLRTYPTNKILWIQIWIVARSMNRHLRKLRKGIYDLLASSDRMNAKLANLYGKIGFTYVSY